ncbi:Peptidase S8/S53 domain-containing protein [Desulfonema limicola]|uniref:Peptidase S8/S53 domain-containing protein n=1 Tax=Desulfonema limicola TaxID=45656 RepID=A0A975BE46_9BACT|nr:S8 family serine peptidase [Desulfonema limicola]QTA83776.1 Peptidase S8/S53 domain-containing protein [Desulfonema limicola]
MIKIVGDIIGSDSLAVIKKLYKDTWSVSGNIGGMDSGARVNKIEDNKWQLKGSIGGYESVGIFQKIQEDIWSLKGDIGGFISRAEIKKTSMGKWQLKGSIGGFNSVAEILIPEQTEQKTKRDYESKISPHFDFSHPDNKSNARQEAVIIYQGQEPDRFRKSGRLYERSEHLDILQNRAEFHHGVENRIFERYLRNCGKGLNVSSIGNSILPVAKVQVTRESLLELSEIPEVLAVMPDHELHLIEPVNMPDIPVSLIEKNDKMTWGIKRLEIPKLWETTKGRGAKVAVLDTGVYGDHPALKSRLKSFILIDPMGRRINAKPSFDAASHGTHVCGTIAGGRDYQEVSIGVAPEASLFAAGILLGGSTVATTIEGLVWAIEKGAGVINMSYGSNRYEPRYELIFRNLIENYDILPVVSIGNSGLGNTGSPGNIASAFSVGAFQKGAENVDFIAPFSSGGSLVFPGDPHHEIITKPDVAAPGVGVYSCIPPLKNSHEEQYAYQSGTSMAAPHVSGVAALLMSAYPGARAKEIMEVLKQTAVHPDGNKKRPDNRWGYGMINPAAACKALSGV